MFINEKTESKLHDATEYKAEQYTGKNIHYFKTSFYISWHILN